MLCLMVHRSSIASLVKEQDQEALKPISKRLALMARPKIGRGWISATN
jgi:hypothetical protein